MKELSNNQQQDDLFVGLYEYAEGTINKSSAMYRSLFMSMQSSFSLNKIILDSRGVPVDYEYIEVNDAFEKVIGKKREEVIGKRATELFPSISNSSTKWIERCGQVALTGEAMTDNDVYSPILDKWVSVSVHSPDKGYFAIILSDITEQKRYTEAMREAKEAAEAASRAKSSFLANMSHEIITPLNGIMGFIDLTLLSDLNEDQRDNLRTIKDSANSLLNIINDILDFSKIEAGKMTLNKVIFDLEELIVRTLKIHEIRAKEKRLNIGYSMGKGLQKTYSGDPNKIQQVLNNLISNSIKFTHKGDIDLDVTSIENKNGFSKLQFTVKDTGIGIAPEDLGKLFKDFSQLDSSITREYGGTGLGLIISKRLVEMMGGSIWVESSKNHGSSFSFTVMLSNEGGVVKNHTRIPEQVEEVKSLDVLLVEDNITNQAVTELMLKQLGHRVDIASDGSEAIDRLNEKDYDAILMDIQMPKMDGVETTILIRSSEQSCGKMLWRNTCR